METVTDQLKLSLAYVIVVQKSSSGDRSDPIIPPLTQDQTLSQAMQPGVAAKNDAAKRDTAKIDAEKRDAAKSDAAKNIKDICHFYTINKCKFGKDCRKNQPKICPKFKKNGIKKFNKNGCEESCTNYHPKACFEAMKNKTCKRPDCKFYHL